MSDYRYRLYAGSDADQAVDLFFECFGKKRTIDEWVWQHHSNPYGQGSIVCESDQKLIGFYGVVFRPLMIRGRELTVGHVIDVMVHPNHQMKGVFMSMASAAFASSKVRGVRLLFGFPNDKAIRGHRKANWREVGARQILRHSLTQLQEPEENENGIVIEWSSWKDLALNVEEIDALFQSSSSKRGFIADRSWRWLQWRYGQKPDSDYSVLVCRTEKDGSLKGWVILRTRRFEGKKVGHIVDWLTEGEGDAAQLLESRALRYFASEGCEYAQCLDNRDSERTQPSSPVWYGEEGRTLDLILRSIDDLGDNTPQVGLSEWYLSLGDCDVF